MKAPKSIGSQNSLGKSRNTNKQISEGVKRQVKQVVKSLQTKSVENKYFDQSLSSGVTAVGLLYNISDITRGTDVTQRVGNQVTLKSIEFRLSFSLNSNVTKAAVRFLVVLDKQGYNAPVVSDILEPGLINTTYTDIAPYHWDYRKRFDVKKDEVVSLTKGGPQEYTTRHFVMPLNLQSQHIGASTTFKNQLYLLVIGSELNIANISSFQYHSRLIFTDE